MLGSNWQLKIVDLSAIGGFTIFLVNLSTKTSTSGDYLEIKFNNRKQVDDKIAWGLGGGFLSFPSSFVR